MKLKPGGPLPTPVPDAPSTAAEGIASPAAAEGIASFDLQGSSQGFDRQFLELTGLAPDDDALRDFDRTIAWLRRHLTDGSAISLEDIARTGATVDAEIEIAGQGRLELKLRPLLHSGGVGGRILSLRSSGEYERLQQRVSQAQKMEAIGRLVGGISHDFNNLLTVIQGYCDFSREQLKALDAELLLSQKHHCTTLRKSLEEIAKASGRASTLTRQLLAYSRQQVLAPQHLDLNVEVREVEKMLKRLLGEKVKLELICGIRPAMVFADRGQMHQMIMNLVINAHDAMPDGGTITLGTEAFTIDTDFAAQFDYPVEVGEKVMLRVQDTGTGIDDEHLARIFEPFFTTKDVGRGTGLGLSTVYGIVKQSGGYIWVESEQGRGTEFKICLPAASGQAMAPVAVVSPHVAAPRGERILIVDDDAQVLEVLAQLLEKSGYRIVAVASPREALDAQAAVPRFDLAITDLLMGEMDGAELARRLQEKQPGLPVLYMSGYDPDAYERRGVMPEKGAFLAKPIDSATLRRRVAQVLKAV